METIVRCHTYKKYLSIKTKRVKLYCSDSIIYIPGLY